MASHNRPSLVGRRARDRRLERDAAAAAANAVQLDLESRLEQQLNGPLEDISVIATRGAESLEQATAAARKTPGVPSTEAAIFANFLKFHTEVGLQGTDPIFERSTAQLEDRASRMRDLFGGT